VPRPAAIIRLATVFAVSLAAGATVVFLGLDRRAERPPPPVPAAVGDRPEAALPGTPAGAERVPPASLPGESLPTAGAPPAPEEPAGAAGTVARGDVPPARAPLPRAEVRHALERALAGRLADRELTPQDYDRLVDAVIRLRTARRLMRGAGESAADSAARDEQRRALLAALGEIEEIVGVPPSALGDALAAGDEPAAAEDDRPEAAGHDGSP
jgi:hypothetical protein